MSNLNSNRLRETRIIRGYTLDELASKIGVTKQAVSKYENGTMTPSSDTLIKIINSLEVPLSFLTKEDITTDRSSGSGNFFFRKLKKTKNSDIDMVRVHAKWFKEVIKELKLDGSYGIKELIRIAKNAGTIEEKALLVRKLWGLGYDPIYDLVVIFENNGIYITKININKSDFDAYTEIEKDQAFIVINSARNISVRQRFNLAHELGHIILHHDYDWNNATKDDVSRMEKEAHSFASEFLIPSEAFRVEFVNDKISSLTLMKKRWGISIQALIYRARELKIISEDRYILLNRQLSARGMKKQEPLDEELRVEMPMFFNKLISMKYYHTGEVDLFLNVVRMSAKDVERVLVLEDGFLSSSRLPQADFGIFEIDNLQLSMFDIRGEA